MITNYRVATPMIHESVEVKFYAKRERDLCYDIGEFLFFEQEALVRETII